MFFVEMEAPGVFAPAEATALSALQVKGPANKRVVLSCISPAKQQQGRALLETLGVVRAQSVCECVCWRCATGCTGLQHGESGTDDYL